MLHQWGLLIALFGQVEEAVEELGSEKQEIYGNSLRILRKVLDLNLLVESWDETRKMISGQALQILRLIAADLDETGPSEVGFDADELNELGKEIQNWIDTVLVSTIDEGWKTLILEQLRKLANAILLYRIRGSEALAEAVDSVYGTIYAKAKSDPAAWGREKESEPVSGLSKLLGKIEQKLGRHPLLAGLGGKALIEGIKALADGS